MHPRLSSFVVLMVLTVCGNSLLAQDEHPRTPGGDRPEVVTNVLVLTLGEATHHLQYAQVAPRPAVFLQLTSSPQTPHAVIVKADSTSSARPYLVRRPFGVVRTDVLIPFDDVLDRNVVAIVLPASDGTSLVFNGAEVLAAVDAARSGRLLAELMRSDTGCGICGCDSGIPLTTDSFASGYTYCIMSVKSPGSLVEQTCQTCYDCTRFFGMDFCSDPHTLCSDADPCVSNAIGTRG